MLNREAKKLMTTNLEEKGILDDNNSTKVYAER